MICNGGYYYDLNKKVQRDIAPQGYPIFVLSCGFSTLITQAKCSTLHPKRMDYQIIYVNKGFLLNLPVKDKPRIVKTDDLMKCRLTSDGSIMVDNRQLTLEELRTSIQEKKAEWPNMTFLLLIDSETEYQKVVDIIYEIKQQKVENFSFRMEDSDV